MTYDNSPGGLDGPPADQKKPLKVWQKVVGAVIVGAPTLLLVLLCAWGIAWLITHFPS